MVNINVNVNVKNNDKMMKPIKILINNNDEYKNIYETPSLFKVNRVSINNKGIQVMNNMNRNSSMELLLQSKDNYDY
jgi:hypothetical protein